MQQNISQNETVEQEVFPTERKQRKGRKGTYRFTYWDREDQLQAFFAWLPQELHDAPGIDWTKLSPEIMCYLINAWENSPDAATMAVVAASANGAMNQLSQKTLTRQVGKLLQTLRATTLMSCLADLKHEQIWHDWADAQENKAMAKQRLASYLAVSTGHFLRYLRRLTLSEQQRMQRYALPPPPIDFAESYFPSKQARSTQRQERKATTDILVPLH